MLRHNGEGFAEGGELRLVELIHEMFADTVDVSRSRLDEQLPAGVGEHGVGSAAIGFARFADDETRLLEPIDLVRKPTATHEREVSELTHAQLTGWGLGQPHEDLVVGHRETVRGLQLS